MIYRIYIENIVKKMTNARCKSIPKGDLIELIQENLDENNCID